ncbi:MAG: Asp23/Gls24 family envelope stress response protein [Clostridiales bacterium]|jgi:uncharacterized alkaline shock family protein YloU|nr:Asp23/Gls24 family envelope stress response protein [Clostridiales bacterium]
MTEIKNGTGIGQIQIADEVIAVIAGTAALEIEGVAGMAGNITGDIAERLGRKNFSKGVKVEVKDESVTVELSLTVKFGCRVQEVSTEVQKRVKAAVETMTGLAVQDVNIIVSGIIHDKEKPKDVGEAF